MQKHHSKESRQIRFNSSTLQNIHQKYNENPKPTPLETLTNSRPSQDMNEDKIFPLVSL